MVQNELIDCVLRMMLVSQWLMHCPAGSYANTSKSISNRPAPSSYPPADLPFSRLRRFSSRCSVLLDPVITTSPFLRLSSFDAPATLKAHSALINPFFFTTDLRTLSGSNRHCANTAFCVIGLVVSRDGSANPLCACVIMVITRAPGKQRLDDCIYRRSCRDSEGSGTVLAR